MKYYEYVKQDFYAQFNQDPENPLPLLSFVIMMMLK